jgi:fused signal recognition particle receptor
VAADTFRAAAIEQLERWSERAGAELIKHREGADPAAVVFDAIRAARKRGIDVVFVDTAGRLHTKTNLMAELEKLARVAGREAEGAPHEVLLVVDATTGQNGLAQAAEFTRVAELTGVVLTKLDGTAKGGVALGIHRRLGVPIRFVGVGEAVDDLLEFDPDAFLEGLLG